MTDNQKRMLFCIEGLRNRDKKHLDNDPYAPPFAEYLLKHFFEELGEEYEPLYESLKGRTGVNIEL